MQSRSRILVIDDDPMFRSLVVSLLRKDYLVSVAADGESGFAKAREHRPDLAIIDYQMPGWNGIKTLQLFRRDRTLSSVKVMMLTSDASKETVLSAIQAGTNEYIIKTSFNKADFLAKVNKLLAPTIVKAVVPGEAGLKAVAINGSISTGETGSDSSAEIEVDLDHSITSPAAAFESKYSATHSLNRSDPSTSTLIDQEVHSLRDTDSEDLDSDEAGRLSEIMDEWED